MSNKFGALLGAFISGVVIEAVLVGGYFIYQDVANPPQDKTLLREKMFSNCLTKMTDGNHVNAQKNPEGLVKQCKEASLAFYPEGAKP